MATVGTNSYISVADFKAWADLRGYEYFDYIDSEISASTVKTAIDFIDPNYTFKGEKLDANQAMQLPSSEVSIEDIQNAAAQAVWQDLKGFLFVAMESQSVNGQIASEDNKLGSLSKSVSYIEGTARTNEYNTNIIDNLLNPYLANSSAGFNSLRVL